jgi:MoaA/NifB/PqqE/SkfB family radical SAM enzyme
MYNVNEMVKHLNEELTKTLILDGTKIQWYSDRVKKWEKGEKIAPITIDMALTRSCNYGCHFCYAMTQENDRSVITLDHMYSFLDDAAEIGVKGVSLVSDGESTVSPIFVESIVRGGENGLSMATATNGFLLNEEKLERILPHLTYIRFNISAGEAKRYGEIMGCKEKWFDRVVKNIELAVKIKKEKSLKVTIGMQMVFMPQYHDQIMPLARLGKKLRPDYLVIKQCSDDEYGSLGVEYEKYKDHFELLKQAEKLSDEEYTVRIKWSKIDSEGVRTYQRCYGAPFLLQMSGSGLVAPCAQLFNEKFKKFHIGNIAQTSFKKIWNSQKYWKVMNHLSSSHFNAQKQCGNLCLAHKVNEFLDGYKKGLVNLEKPSSHTKDPQHLSFV